MSSLEQFGKAFFPPKDAKVSTCFGEVASINADGSYQVTISSQGNARAVACCTASVGDRVFVVIQENGHCVAVGKVV